MNDIRRVVARVAGRLNWIRFVHQAVRAGLYLALICMLVLALDKVVHLGVPAVVFFAAYLPLALLAALFLTYRKRASVLEAAVGLDARLDLKERVSSALAIGEPTRPAEAALIEDAASRVRNVEPGKLFPLRAPRELKWLPLPLGLAVALVFVPSIDLFGREKEEIKKDAERKQLETKVEKLDKEMKSLKEKLKGDRNGEVSKLLDDLSKLVEDLRTSPDKKDALRKLDHLAERARDLEQQVEPFDTQKHDARAGDQTNAVRESLAKADFAKAAEGFEKLSKQVENRELSTDQHEKLANDLKSLSRDVSRNEKLSQALQEAGKDLSAGQDAKAAQDLKAAAEDLKDLENVKEQLDLVEEMLKTVETTKDELAQDTQGQKAGDPKEDGVDQSNLDNVKPFDKSKPECLCEECRKHGCDKHPDEDCQVPVEDLSPKNQPQQPENPQQPNQPQQNPQQPNQPQQNPQQPNQPQQNPQQPNQPQQNPQQPNQPQQNPQQPNQPQQNPQQPQPKCKTCGGTGVVEKPCENCKASGAVLDKNNELQNCPACDGNGKKKEPCPDCQGKGTPQPTLPGQPNQPGKQNPNQPGEGQPQQNPNQQPGQQQPNPGQQPQPGQQNPNQQPQPGQQQPNQQQPNGGG